LRGAGAGGCEGGAGGPSSSTTSVADLLREERLVPVEIEVSSELSFLLAPSCEKGLGAADEAGAFDVDGFSASAACGFGVDEEEEGFAGSSPGDEASSGFGVAVPSFARRRARI
jgi:hypothetical protein